MAQRAITNPTMVINNVAVGIVPNSLNYTEGLGEQEVKTQAAGNGSIETVYFDNAETKMSKVMFKVFPTQENIDAQKEWKRNGNGNAISLTTPQGFTRSFSNMAMVNDPEIATSADGEIDIEFMGDSGI